MSDFADLNRRSLALAEQFNEARAAARRPDPDLTPEAQERRQLEASERVVAQFGPQFDALRARADLLRDVAGEQSRRVRPTLDPSDTAGLVRTEQAWSHNVRPLLERGATLEQALAFADLDAVLGAERFAAGWLAQHASADSDQDVRAVTRQAVAEALAGLQSDPAAGAAILAGESAAQDHANAVAVLSQAREGRTLEASLLAHYSGANSAE